MSTDLVERLRGRATTSPHDFLNQAAKEIEHLRAENERLSQRLADEAGCMVCNFRERRACWEAGEKDKAEIDRLRSEIELKSRILGWLLNQRADGSVYIRYDEDAVLAAKTYFSLLRDETDTQTPCP
jgi:hypothetical protein